MNDCLKVFYKGIFLKPVSRWACSGGFMKRGGDSEAGGGGRAEQNKKDSVVI